MNNVWYAVMANIDDADWGFGSHNLDEAMAMLRDFEKNNPDCYIAVIEDEECVDIIQPKTYLVKDDEGEYVTDCGYAVSFDNYVDARIAAMDFYGTVEVWRDDELILTVDC